MTGDADFKIEIGRVVGRGVEVLVRNWAMFLGVPLVLSGIPTFALTYVEAQFWIDDLAYGWMVAPLVYLVWMIANTLVQAVLTRTAVLDLIGQPSDPVENVAVTLRMLPALCGVAVLSGIGLVLGFLLLVVPGVILYLMWIVAVPAMVEERLGPVEGLRRSAELTRGSKGRILVLAVIGLVFSVVLSMASVFQSATDFDAAAAIFDALSATVTGAVYAAVTASLYYELRLAAIFE